MSDLSRILSVIARVDRPSASLSWTCKMRHAAESVLAPRDNVHVQKTVGKSQLC